MSSIEFKSFKDCMDLHDGINFVFSMKPKNISSLKGLTNTQNFGNPFITDTVAERWRKRFKSKVVGKGNVIDVSKLFISWIAGKEETNVKPYTRDWLRKVLKERTYENSTFLYYTNSNTTSHIWEFICVINALKEHRGIIDDVVLDDTIERVYHNDNIHPGYSTSNAKQERKSNKRASKKEPKKKHVRTTTQTLERIEHDRNSRVLDVMLDILN